MSRKIREPFFVLGRLLFVCLILIGTFVFAMFQGGLVSWTIFYALLPFLIYSIGLFFYPLSSFHMKRTLQSSYLQKGERLQVTINIRKKSLFPLLYIVFSDCWKDEQRKEVTEERHKMFIWGWKKQAEWQYEIQNMPRGEYNAPNIRMEIIDFFGWIRKSKVIPLYSQLIVYPPTVPIKLLPVGTGEEGSFAISPFNLMKDTTVVTGVRDYQSGDRVSWIHWKSFARTETLMAKEFEDKSSEDLTLIFDQRMSATFEDEIIFAASILKEAVKAQLSVQFLQTNQYELRPTIQSEMEFSKILTDLAKTQPVQAQNMLISPALKRQLERSRTLIIITGNLDRNFLENIQSVSRKRRSIICFIVVKNKKAINGILLENMKYAESVGMTVRPVMKKQFTEAFKEVVKK